MKAATSHKLWISSIVILIIFIFAFGMLYFNQRPLPDELPIPLDPLLDENIKVTQNIDLIVVEKASRKITLFHQQVPIKSYKIALGFEPMGHKTQEGDGKTPEGTYQICAKNPKSQFHLSLKISYPSHEDKQQAKQNGVSPGGEIMIHGLATPFSFLGKHHSQRDWTLGCIALSNEEMEEIYANVAVGTKIIIKP
ncbi:L,D-transpeptidase family protein [Candidatus Berkiella aquae]|uniref:L,D-transpeptidase catalytic domain n=1 Tax=Candidatus Berkiella aquae TaxID=295108 RepID=A0A0Q9Z0I5_9GAMM|nr:L,D-transpeptidase family protein [Candidatus Berkiella aquae]MCS5712084.1 L,D-transpeptidase family protein [Candidatus Berkiella aquae]